MTVSSTVPLPEKDFKAQIKDDMVMKVGIDIFDDAMEAQALYHLKRRLENLARQDSRICEAGNTGVMLKTR